MEITKDMTIIQVLNADRTTAKVFMEHGLHCLGCPYSTQESIEQAGAVHGIDVGALIAALNEHVNQK